MKPMRPGRVAGAFGLAINGISLGTFPFPLQMGQGPSIIPLALAFCPCFSASINLTRYQAACPFIRFRYMAPAPPKIRAIPTVPRAMNMVASCQKPPGKSIIR